MAETPLSKAIRHFVFLGTVAELIKMLSVLREFNQRGVPWTLIATGQNDLVRSGLLSWVGKESPDVVLSADVIPQHPRGLGLWFVRTLWRAREQLRPVFAGADPSCCYLIVHGDTVSTLMGAILGRWYRVPVVHVEAGLRSRHLLNPFPEELDRWFVSHLTTLHCCPNDWAAGNLVGYRGEILNTGENTLIESLQMALEQNVPTESLPALPATYGVCIVHRQENLYNQRLLTSLINQIEQVSQKIACCFILHEPTRVALLRQELLAVLERAPNVVLTPRLPYPSMVQLLQRCAFLITDGGSNQEEAYYLGVPCLLLRRRTERVEGLGQNVLLSDCDPEKIAAFVANYSRYRRPPVAIHQRPSRLIIDRLLQESNVPSATPATVP